ncbi:hypothetical protein ACT3TB_19395 [Micrococcaceae sp. AOP34-BR2-30]
MMATNSILVIASLVLFIAEWWAHRRWQATVERPALLRKNLTSVLRTDLPPGTLLTSGHSFGSFFRPGTPRKIKIRAAGLPPMEGETAKRVLHITGEICENTYLVDQKKSSPGKRIIMRQKPKEKTAELTSRESVEQSITKAAAEIFPRHNPKVTCTWDEESETDYLLDVTITGVNGMDLSLSGKRRQVLVKLRTRLPKGNFTSDVDPGEDAIYFHRSRPLPSVVVPPKAHAPLLVSHGAYSKFCIPLGIGDNGEQAVWHPKKDAHLLIIGGTGGGKTIAEHGVVQRLAQAGWRTWLVDGKRIEFIGYRGWANVELLAQKVDHQIRVLKLAHETMEARYDLIERGEVRIEDLDPIAVVVDELTSLLMAVKRRYQDTKVKGMPSQHPVLEWVADIARLGRSSKMHLVLGLQRPDASIMGGEMRDNFGGRISLGKLQSKEASMMMWDDPAIGVSVPNIKGRAVSYVNGQLSMVQGTFTANPDPNHDDYQPGMVEAMRPTHEVYSRKTIASAEPDEGSEAGEITWNSIIEAVILGDDGMQVEFDPVASDESKAMRRNYNGAEPSEASDKLQAAENFNAAMNLFAYDPLVKVTYGLIPARKISQVADDLHCEDSEVVPAPVESQRITGIPIGPLGQGSTTELRYIEAGQNVVIDEIGGDEITVSSCEPDEGDPNIYYFSGWTADGEAVHVELPAETSVEVFEMEPA